MATEIGSECKIKSDPITISDEEAKVIQKYGILRRRSGSKTSDGDLIAKEINIDISRIIQLAQNYEELQEQVRTVESEILDFFQNSDRSTHTTSEVVEHLGRPSSTVSRNLGALTEQGLLTQVERGVYRSENN